MKFKRVWFFGGDKRDESFEDWVEKYIADNGKVIEVEFGLLSNRVIGYKIDGKFYQYLKDAKLACEG